MPRIAYVLLGVVLFVGSITLVIMGVPMVLILLGYILLVVASVQLRRLGWVVSFERKQTTVPPPSSEFWYH